MNKLYRVMRILLLGAVLMSLCVAFYYYISSDEGNVPMILAQEKFREFEPTSENVKPIGRTYYENGVRYLSYSGSGVEFSLRGEYVTVSIIGDGVEYTSSNHQPRFAIYKNGEIIVDDVVSQSEKNYHIDIGGYGEDTVIKIIKLSEAKHSTFGVGTIGAFGKGNIKPTDEKDLKIEFIGDSITCGYGVDEENPDGVFSTTTENFTKTYAYMTAQNLDADYSAVAFSGYGVLSGYTHNGRINDEAVLDLYYDKSCFLSGGRESFWDFSKFQSDIVVINLGTNDASYCSKSRVRRQAFVNKYVDFLTMVRHRNPEAYILCILGDMNNSLYPCIEEAVNIYKEGTADYKIEAATIEYKMGENDIVIDGHPGYLSNIHAANILSEKINSLRGAAF